MVEDKPTTFLVPVRDLVQMVHQRRHLTNRLLLAVVVAAVIYCLAISTLSWSPARQHIQNVFVGPAKGLSEAAAPVEATAPEPPSPEPAPSSTTTSRPFNAATTMKAQTGPHQPHFRQLPMSVVVVRTGGDVQLDCALEAKPNDIVTWYKGKDVFFTIGNRTHRSRYDPKPKTEIRTHQAVTDGRVEKYVDEQSLNWALRIKSVMMSDAGTYSCHLELGPHDFITVQLDVLPMDDAISPKPARLPNKVVDLFVPGFLTLPGPEVCPDEGAGINTIIAVASHPLFVSSRDRARNSWATATNKKHQAIVFGVGEISADLTEKINSEADKNHDMLMGKLRDVSTDPYVEGFKRLALLQWVTEHCRWAKFTLLLTHDEFVNPHLLQQLVETLNPDERAVYGLTDGERTVQRDPNEPHYLSYASYQLKTLPEFVRQPVMLVSRAAVSPLYEAALETRDVPHYDILLTALAAPKANITRKHTANLYKKVQGIQACDYEKFVTGRSWGDALDRKVAKRIAAGEKCEVKG